jgi:hypothetical protein
MDHILLLLHIYNILVIFASNVCVIIISFPFHYLPDFFYRYYCFSSFAWFERAVIIDLKIENCFLA